jgi:hypothetical protein
MNVRPFIALVLLLPLAALGACSGGSSSDGGGKALVGTFAFTPGTCSGDKVTGTYFRMISPGGTVAKGGYFQNPDSPCPDKSFTTEVGGSDGGLVTGTYQPASGRAFDATGNSRAGRIFKPGSFTAIKFGISTNKIDPQTKKKVLAPKITVKDGKLSGQITAWTAAWNNLYFNQGSPKPDGSRPGITTPLTGTYDSKTGKYVITWASQIVGGPFNRFTGYWHLEGSFTPAK